MKFKATTQTFVSSQRIGGWLAPPIRKFKWYKRAYLYVTYGFKKAFAFIGRKLWSN
jgi:hypothetical protein